MNKGEILKKKKKRTEPRYNLYNQIVEYSLLYANHLHTLNKYTNTVIYHNNI